MTCKYCGKQLNNRKAKETRRCLQCYHKYERTQVIWNKGLYGDARCSESSKKAAETRKKNGFTIWNKGLTKYDHPGVMAIARSKLGKSRPDISGKNCNFYIDGRSKLGYEDTKNFKDKKIRLRLLENQNYTCPICGEKWGHSRWDLHHIDGNHKNDNPWDFIWLCKSCHLKIRNDDFWESTLGMYRQEIIGEINHGTGS